MTLKSLFVTAGVSVLAGLPAASWAQTDRLAMLRHEFAPSSTADRPVLVVAHRGCWKATAENSLAAIEACIALGVDVVELDARRTVDGALVLMHDATVDRMTNGHGRVEDLTLAQSFHPNLALAIHIFWRMSALVLIDQSSYTSACS